MFSGRICVFGFVALATLEVTAGQDGRKSTAEPESSSPTQSHCGSFPISFATAPTSEISRPVNASSTDKYCDSRHSHRLHQSPETALWMFVEFLKAAPLVMGMGCITMVFVALGQKWLALDTGEAKTKIRWTKPTAC